MSDYPAVVRRQAAWIIGSAVVCVLLSLAYSYHEAKYVASSSVDVPTVATPLSRTPLTIVRGAAPADTLPVAKLAVQQAGMPHMSGKDLLAASAVVADTRAKVLRFTVTANSADRAVKLANGYANAYLNYVSQQLKTMVRRVRAHMAQLTKSQGAKLPALKADANRLNYLATALALTKPPNEATRASPTSKTSRNVLLAAVFGAAVGLILAFVTEVMRAPTPRRPSAA